eukprot:11436252-Ditylum_brightwellii.AAC.1
MESVLVGFKAINKMNPMRNKLSCCNHLLGSNFAHAKANNSNKDLFLGGDQMQIDDDVHSAFLW